MTASRPPRQLLFDPPPEIFATDSSGRFFFPLTVEGEDWQATGSFDEVRFVTSVWHPASGRTIDLDRAYVELVCRLDPREERWIKLAEIEPVVPPFDAGNSFDGWIVLPVVGESTAYALSGSGLDARMRLQIRASAYLIA